MGIIGVITWLMGFIDLVTKSPDPPWGCLHIRRRATVCKVSEYHSGNFFK